MAEKIRECKYCGKKFTVHPKKPGHNYCTRQCGSKATYKRQNYNATSRVWGHEKNVFETAMELDWNGEESGAISRKLQIPVGTIYSWVHDFGSQRQRKEPLKKLLNTAQSAVEWLNALRKNTESESHEDMPIYLVCGMFCGQSVDRLTGIIFERLNESPLNGNVYAFCNKTRNTITTFAWKPPVFNIAKHVKMYGTFIWPGENLGRTIEVTKSEFDRLILLNKQEILAEKTAKTLML